MNDRERFLSDCTARFQHYKHIKKSALLESGKEGLQIALASVTFGIEELAESNRQIKVGGHQILAAIEPTRPRQTERTVLHTFDGFLLAKGLKGHLPRPKEGNPNVYYWVEGDERQPNHFHIRHAHLSVRNLDGGLFVFSSEFERLLRSHNEPYSDLDDLLSEFGLIGFQGNSGDAKMRLTLQPIAYISANTKISSERLHLELGVADSVPNESIRIGYKSFTLGGLVARGQFDLSDAIEVSTTSGVRQLKLEKDLADCAAAQLFLSVGGDMQHHCWFNDIDKTFNVDDEIYRLIDGDREILTSWLTDRMSQRRPDARKFEFAVAAVAHLLGFRVLPIQDIGELSEFADILVSLDSSRHMLFECTISTLNPKGKLAKLRTRVGDVKARLENRGINNVEVIPVIVSALKREDLEADMAAARSAGIVVIDQVELAELVELTMLPQNAHARYQSIRDRYIELTKTDLFGGS